MTLKQTLTSLRLGGRLFALRFIVLLLALSFSGAYARAQNCQIGRLQQEVLLQVNRARSSARSCGVEFFKAAPALKWNFQLAAAATEHSADMANHNYFEHASRNGLPFTDRIARNGYNWRAAGENISAGRETVQAAINSWIKSPGHCANIMSAQFREIGVACGYHQSSTYKTYWTMDLGQAR